MNFRIFWTCLWVMVLSVSSNAQKSFEQVSFGVAGVCGMCKDRIEEAASSLKGVKNAEWLLSDQSLTISINPNRISIDQVHEVIAGVGHDTDQVRADDEVYNNLHGCCKYRDEAVIQAHQPTPKTASFFVDGICGMCEDRIEAAALSVGGVEEADWSVDDRSLFIRFNSQLSSILDVQQAIAEVGHDTEEIAAEDDIYNNLHGCCKYRDEAVIQAHQPQTSTSYFFVDGVCGMCKDRIEQVALTMTGIESAEWSVDTKVLAVTAQTGTLDSYQLQWNLASAGHDTEAVKAPSSAYQNLHGCCKYRDEAIIQAHQDPTSEVAKMATLTGTVTAEDPSNPLPGVTIFWLEDPATGTTSNPDGSFSLDRPGDAEFLVFSFIGFASDTIQVSDQASLDVALQEGVTLETVKVSSRKKTTEFSFLASGQVQQIGEEEFLKAACCNLSESFTTIPSVDVGFTDAVTGTRQIRMLGLASPYVQISQENIPLIRGNATIKGLELIPGPWLEGVQLIKGSGSVVNGYDAIAGQINLEMHKPEKDEALYLHLYGNEGSRFEGNLIANHSFNERWHTGLSIHGKSRQVAMDRNDDGFTDNPLDNTLVLLNRWRYLNKNGIHAQFGVRYSYTDHESGQLIPNAIPETPWQANWNEERLEGWFKTGIVLPRPGSSIALQLSASQHTQDARFGLRPYQSFHQVAYANLIYQDMLGSSFHTYKVGASFQYDQVEESLSDQAFAREEAVPGVFAEYTYKPSDNLSLVSGLRFDYHNLFGAFLTPRLQFRFNPGPQSVVRASINHGRRTPTLIAENIGALASSRELIFLQEDAALPYGLQQETAWNFGASYGQDFKLGAMPVSANIDFYHLRFQQQVIVDYDQDPGAVYFYNLDGASYSNNAQIQLDGSPLENLDLRLAYRFSDVQADFMEVGLRERPFVSRHRAFLNAAYTLPSGWAFDATLNWQGAQRLPDTDQKAPEWQLPGQSPDFFQVNAQITKKWEEKGFEVFTGVENLLNYRQENPILDPRNPFSDQFDASLVWGPIFGRMVYGGIRFRLQKS
jgi:outer membrane receptor for ferrienterochelin and colicins